MRTTLDIDPDVLLAAKELAEHRGTTAGKVLSDLARKALAPKRRAAVRNGIRLLPCRPAGSPRPTLELVNRLRDEP
ncbi:MAG: CopG family transcriptional regulator [Acidobacteria bacterium]|nr:CopG family transcriptional regulator [Acidobacteriota bacterium]